MKGGFYGLKVSQVSLILIGFVCLAVLMLAWTKTTLLTSLDPPTSEISYLTPEILVIIKESVGSISVSIKEFASSNYVSQNTSSSKLAKKDLISPESPGDLESLGIQPSSEGEHNDYLKNFTQKQDCNFAKGKWVMDDTRPLYSGLGCKQWLSSMWACRVTQRTDFDYEKLRWRPKDCDMDDFTDPKFFEKDGE